MTLAAARRRRPVPPAAGILLLAALVATTLGWASFPGRVLAANPMVAACDGVNLRIDPVTTALSLVRIATGSQVGVTATVDGGAWSATCAGVTSSATSWHQIDSVNGASVQALYGVPFVYGATGLFTPTVPGPLPTPTPIPTPTPTPIADLAILEGIDVSHWQGPIDWLSVAASGKRFAYLKASEGTTLVDETYATNRAQAKAAGLTVGAYHFGRPDATPGDAIAEADHFLATAQIAAGELRPVLDLEATGGLSVPDLQAWVQAFLVRVYERAGVPGVIYVSPNFWKSRMGDSTWFAMNGYRTVWVAHWTDGPVATVPGGNWGGQGWTFWQYTSSGSVPGITGRVDLNRYNGLDLTPLLLTSTPYIPAEPVVPVQPSISLTTSAPMPPGAQSPVIDWGQGLVLGVALNGTGASTANRSLQLEGSLDHLTWTPIATLTTDATGGVSYPYRPVTNLYYRITFAGSMDGLPPLASNEVRTVVRQLALLRPTNLGATRSIRRSSSIAFTTTVRPARPELAAATVSFYLYRQVSGAWQQVTKRDVVVDAAGLARTTFKFSSSGQWYVRSQANATPANANSVMSPLERFVVR